MPGCCRNIPISLNFPLGADDSRALVDVGCDRPSYEGQQIDLVASLVATSGKSAYRRLLPVARTR
jgi:hypothetical protein